MSIKSFKLKEEQDIWFLVYKSDGDISDITTDESVAKAWEDAVNRHHPHLKVLHFIHLPPAQDVEIG